MFYHTKWKLSFLILCIIIFPIRVQAASTPNDPLYEKQYYHSMTKMSGAWEDANQNTDIQIAILDTGIELNHPDLKDNLVPGHNLVHPGKLPIDDNGHGTATAGILAASGSNKIGVVGGLWKAKILPIKILDQKGGGDAARLTKGIRLAIDQGAKIILLSLGDPIYSLEMEKAVQYAEEKGVLLIAATGNDSRTVNYPAAFPTVLSVGAVDQKLQPLGYSNRGPELDVVAPGYEIYSTALNGNYKAVSGTSMAAPQVAALAALILKKNSSLEPWQVRQVIRASAGNKSWNKDTGYGLINAEKALSMANQPLQDVYEPNETLEKSSPLPAVTQTYASIGTQDPMDWYRVELPYAGQVRITLEAEHQGFTMEVLDSSKVRKAGGQVALETRLPKGTHYLKIQYTGKVPSLPYKLTTRFSMDPDLNENNDTKEKAVRLPASSYHSVTGNFHRIQDVDWFNADYPWPGKLRLEVKTDTLRMDPVLTIEQVGKWKEVVDNGSVSNRQAETWSKHIEPGTFYYQLKDYYGNVIVGEYQFHLSYEAEHPKGLIDISSHWARESIEALVKRELILGYPDRTFRPNQVVTRASAAVILGELLEEKKSNSLHALKDLPTSHWAYSSIQALIERGVLDVSQDGRIYPDQPLTRAELAEILYKAKYGTLPLAQAEGKFSDVPRQHKAHSYIMKMAELKHLQGFADGTFRPERTTTRAEFATLIHRMWLGNE